MNQDDKERQREEFLKILNEIGIKDIKDVVVVNAIPKNSQDKVWIIK